MTLPLAKYYLADQISKGTMGGELACRGEKRNTWMEDHIRILECTLKKQTFGGGRGVHRLDSSS